MKSKINYLLTFITLTTMGISFNAVAAEKPIFNSINSTTEIAQNTSPTKQRGENKGDKLMEKLNLSAEQKQRIESIRTKFEPQMTSIREQMRIEREKMSTMMQNNESQNNLRAQHQKISALQQQMNNLRFESMLETREVLTPQQRQQFSQNMEERRANWREKRSN
ncbi:Spy/CpxP family protein refolding chaperone [Geminocystis sp. GBBB08]|uniref:Spy/CpxP family protein refolding chaperone n=1 Tax=Geminocystis sp. GBBB08 TaxID=2604140 RepID=UPI0027E2A82C|nr:Spy/CpxP family protein refolding chaperone [Geminocystis sp. GBBB08]MBL1209391.1 periplasmic heavy metal sensor [Geminocystis sp. GBBB08]